MRYVVTVPYVVLKVLDPMSGAWTMRGFYKDMLVPDGVDADNLKHHIDGDMVKPMAEPEEPKAPEVPKAEVEPVKEPAKPVKSAK